LGPVGMADMAVGIAAGTDGAASAEKVRQAGARRRETAEAFEQLIGEIRQLPGFDHFLLPPPLAELQAVAGREPGGVVTVSQFGSYALVVTGAGVLEPLPLPEVTPESVGDRVTEFLDALDTVGDDTTDEVGRAGAEARLAGVLGWLWDAVAGPVLEDRLGL